jgi:cysteine desulfurase/selenocysteine lyase
MLGLRRVDALADLTTSNPADTIEQLGEHVMNRFRRLFPITKAYVYLNSAATSPLASPVKEAMEECIRDQHETGNQRWEGGWTKTELEVRQQLAELTGVSAEEIAIVGNTVQGLSAVANGVEWTAGDNVVANSLENPANIYPWLNLEQRFGIEVRIVDAEDGRIRADDLLAAADGHTRVITVSSVQWTNGFKADLASLGQFCRGRGIYLVVDAIQGLGALSFHPRELNIDFFSAGAYKALLGPVGIGCFFCRKELLDDLWPANAGHRSVVEPTSTYHRMDLHPSAQRFEGGALNYVGLYGLQASLDIIKRAGIREIEAHVLGLTDLLIRGLLEKGYRVRSSLQPEERSGIVSFDHAHQDSATLLRILADSKTIVSLRDGAIRASVHLYNNEEDIARLLGLLP